MLPEGAAQPEEPCPVCDETLGDLYRAEPEGLRQLIATVPATTRAVLAIYCFRRSHLASVGLAIAATCTREDLTASGGNTGAALFDRSQESMTSSVLDLHIPIHGRKKITLASGPLYHFDSASGGKLD